MNYYKRNIGDYAAATRHLSIVEHGVYSLMIDTYYTNECPFPADVKQVARKIGARSSEEIEAVENVLNDFFVLESDGWHQKRCDTEIAAYHAKAETNRVIGAKGGRPRKQTESDTQENPEITQTVSEQNPQITLTKNQEPRTINQELSNDNSSELLAQGEQQPQATATPTPEKQKRSNSQPKEYASKPDDVSDQVWREWLTVRNKKPTPLVITNNRTEAEKAGMTLEQALTYAVSKGWQTFDANWWANREKAIPVATVAPMQNYRPQQQPMSRQAQGIALLQGMKRAES